MFNSFCEVEPHDTAFDFGFLANRITVSLSWTKTKEEGLESFVFITTAVNNLLFRKKMQHLRRTFPDIANSREAYVHVESSLPRDTLVRVAE